MRYSAPALIYPLQVLSSSRSLQESLCTLKHLWLLTVLSEKHINWEIRAFISQAELYPLFVLILQHCSNFAFIHFLPAFPFPNSDGKTPLLPPTSLHLLPLLHKHHFADVFSPTTSAFPTLRFLHPLPLLLQQQIPLFNFILQS